jgi:hypothetical protein
MRLASQRGLLNRLLIRAISIDESLACHPAVKPEPTPARDGTRREAASRR